MYMFQLHFKEITTVNTQEHLTQPFSLPHQFQLHYSASARKKRNLDHSELVEWRIHC